jgi:hypothetical protein
MMATTDCKQFLQHVLPHTGPYCIFGLSPTDETRRWNRGVATIDAAVSAAKEIDERYGMHAFVAVGALIEREEQYYDDDGNTRTRTARTTENIRGMRAYTMDIDAGPHHKTGAMRSYETTEDALAALNAFIARYNFPQPTLVQSGQGLHVWWTLSDEVPAAVWSENGAHLLAMAAAVGFEVDGGRTTNITSVLRVAGRRNHKYAEKPVVGVLQYGADTDTVAFHALIDRTLPVPAAAKKAAAAPSTVGIPGLEGGPKISLPGNNTAKVYTPNLDITKLDAECDAWYLATNDEAQANDHVPEPVWLRVLQLAVHVGGRDTAHAISMHDPRYSVEATDAKLHGGRKPILNANDEVVMGPASCADLRAAYMEAWPSKGNPCVGCSHYIAAEDKHTITSPAVVSHITPAVPDQLPPNKTEVLDTDTGETHVEEVDDPPEPYVRLARGMAYRKYNPKTEETDLIIFCPYDMYPKRLQADEEGKQYGVVWMVNYPMEGWQERHIEHVGTQTLRVTLAKWGIFIAPKDIERMADFMSAYTDKLQRKIPTEIEFDRCGWRDTGFVLGDKLINNKGVIETHAMSKALAKSVAWLGTAGERDAYIKALRPYGHKECFEFREFVAISLGSIFYCFSGEIATTFNATGTSGVGKSTIMRVAAAMFGSARDGIIREFTRMGVERVSGHHNHLPLFVDEVTGKKDGEYTEFLFQYSGGKGKVKLDRESQLRGDCPTWNNICLTNSNNDVYAGVSTTVKDLQAHLARIIQIEFPKTTAISKEDADEISSAVAANYGHAILDVLQWAVPRRKDHEKAILKIKREIEKRVGGDLSVERFKIAEIACAIYAMRVLDGLGYIMTWPVDEDRESMIQQLLEVREDVKKLEMLPEDYLGAFLDEHSPNTLTMNAKASGNIDNVVSGPTRELYIRKELDTRRIFVSRDAFNRWCKLSHVHADRQILALFRSGVIVRDLLRRVLGAGTPYEGGQVSCFEIDLNRLSGTMTVVPSLQPAASVAAPKAASI